MRVAFLVAFGDAIRRLVSLLLVVQLKFLDRESHRLVVWLLVPSIEIDDKITTGVHHREDVLFGVPVYIPKEFTSDLYPDGVGACSW